MVVSVTVWRATDTTATDNLLATDKEIKITVPVLTNSLPVQLGSSLSTQYVADQSPDPAAGMLHLGNMTLEEGIRYPSLIGEIYSGNSLGEKLTPAGKDGFPMLSPNSTYLTSWLTKQWASVDLSLAHLHLIERPEDQLTVGVTKAFFALNKRLSFSLGEHLFSDLDNRYWSRTTDMSLGYSGRKYWDFSMSLEQRQDPRVTEQSVWATLKTKF